MNIKEKILNNISNLIDKQNAKGLKKYGQSIDDCPPRDYDWQNMIIEELIDALQYQQKQMQELEEKYYNLKESAYETQMDFLDANKYRNIYKEQNERFREALEKIKQDGQLMNFNTDRKTYNTQADIARKALEGEE